MKWLDQIQFSVLSLSFLFFYFSFFLFRIQCFRGGYGRRLFVGKNAEKRIGNEKKRAGGSQVADVTDKAKL
jgi:hypothetical protein